MKDKVFILPYEKWKYSQWARDCAKSFSVSIGSSLFKNFIKGTKYYYLLGTVQEGHFVNFYNRKMFTTDSTISFNFFEDEYISIEKYYLEQMLNKFLEKKGINKV